MHKEIDIHCPKCSTVTIAGSEQLTPHMGRKAKVKCSNKDCKHVISVIVNRSLFENGRFKVGESGHHTVILGTGGLKADLKNLPKIKFLSNEFHQEQVLALSKGDNLIGRASSSDADNPMKKGVNTTDKTMSRSHCYIHVLSNKDIYRLCIRDNNSLNKVYVNGEVLDASEDVFLEPNDEVIIGNSKFIIHID